MVKFVAIATELIAEGALPHLRPTLLESIKGSQSRLVYEQTWATMVESGSVAAGSQTKKAAHPSGCAALKDVVSVSNGTRSVNLQRKPSFYFEQSFPWSAWSPSALAASSVTYFPALVLP